MRVVPAAEGGPKEFVLLPLGRFLFADWLPQSSQPVGLIGAPIGAWGMAAATLKDPAEALAAFEYAYIHQDFDVPPCRSIHAMFGKREFEVRNHPRYRLHVLTSRGGHLLRRDTRLRSPLGYAGCVFHQRGVAQNHELMD